MLLVPACLPLLSFASSMNLKSAEAARLVSGQQPHPSCITPISCVAGAVTVPTKGHEM